MGWYSTGSEPTSFELAIHKQITNFNESPLYMQLNPVVGVAKELPISIFESLIDIEQDQARTLFVPVPYTIETGEAERIAVDHVSRAYDAGNSTDSQAVSHLASQHNAVNMLSTRVKVLLDYLVAVKKGELPGNHKLLRDIAGLCNRLPVMSTPAFKEEYMSEYNDVLLMTYLATITKGSNAINELVNKVNVFHDKQISRRGRPYF
eukprot:Colp12_sorted_trinity150504_noHs@8104